MNHVTTFFIRIDLKKGFLFFFFQVNKKKSKDDFKNLFASAEEFAEILEEGDNDGGSHAVSNKDRAGEIFIYL